MTYLYHEKQDSALCAVHSLNNLLQGQYYSAVELMNIAQELDAKEQILMQELGNDTQDFRKYMSEESGNVAVDGNFSVEVIKKALHVFNLVSTPLNHPEMKEASEQPQRENGFICNLSNHWFAIRNVSGKFWDLNSLHKQPVYLSEIYLGAFLKQLQVEGYTIYVVRGPFPEIYRDYDSRDWVLAPTSNNRQNNNNTKNNEEDDLAKAIAASLGNKNNNNNTSKQPESPWGTNLHSLKSLSDSVGSGLEDDDELARAIALSRTTAEAERETKRRKPNPEDIPEEPLTTESDLANIMVRLPSGKKVGRRFRQSNLLEDVFSWIYVTNEIDLFDGLKYNLVSSVDRKPLTQKKATLGDLSCKGNVLLVLELV
jgi:ataxin-3